MSNYNKSKASEPEGSRSEPEEQPAVAARKCRVTHGCYVTATGAVIEEATGRRALVEHPTGATLLLPEPEVQRGLAAGTLALVQ